MAQPIFALLLACALPFAVLSSSAEGEAAGALAADDECSASGGPGCALNELQLRAKAQDEAVADDVENLMDDDPAGAYKQCGGGRDYTGPTTCIQGFSCVRYHETYAQCNPSSWQSLAEASGEQDVGADDTAGTARWYLGRVGETCTQACSSHRLACSPSDFRLAANWQNVWSFAAQAGAKCTMSWANDNMHGMGFTVGTPSVCMQTRCGSDLPGTCAYDATVRSTCDGLPATGFQRLCPCGASSGYSVPVPAPYYPHSVPVPAPYYPHSAPAPYYPHSAPAPYYPHSVPAPAPHYPQSAPAAPCDSDTGGTCSWMSCAKSRGDGVSCEKSGGKHKCLCKAGYCAVKGVCKQTYR